MAEIRDCTFFSARELVHTTNQPSSRDVSTGSSSALR